MALAVDNAARRLGASSPKTKLRALGYRPVVVRYQVVMVGSYRQASAFASKLSHDCVYFRG